MEKPKSVANEQLTARKSQEISSTIEVEKVANKKSIYLKSAEFLLKYNVATVRNFYLFDLIRSICLYF